MIRNHDGNKYFFGGWTRGVGQRDVPGPLQTFFKYLHRNTKSKGKNITTNNYLVVNVGHLKQTQVEFKFKMKRRERGIVMMREDHSGKEFG